MLLKFQVHVICHAIIGAFDDVDLRKDKGALFENFFIAERQKAHDLAGDTVEAYFWRTINDQEIDLVEESNGGLRLDAFECKSRKKSNETVPSAWKKFYPDSSFTTITPQNISDHLV